LFLAIEWLFLVIERLFAAPLWASVWDYVDPLRLLRLSLLVCDRPV
jgi:hypothetical protein